MKLLQSSRESTVHCTSENIGPPNTGKFLLRFPPRLVWPYYDYYVYVFVEFGVIVLKLFIKDTNRKIRKTEFINICGSKNGSNSSAINTCGV